MLSMSVKAQTDVNVIPYGNNKAVGNSISIDGKNSIMKYTDKVNLLC